MPIHLSLTCPICQRPFTAFRYNKTYCGPACRGKAERQRKVKVAAEERDGRRMLNVALEKGFVFDATHEMLRWWERRLTEHGNVLGQEFVLPTPGWQPHDPRVTWTQSEETGRWMMLFVPEDVAQAPAVPERTKTAVDLIEQLYGKHRN